MYSNSIRLVIGSLISAGVVFSSNAMAQSYCVPNGGCVVYPPPGGDGVVEAEVVVEGGGEEIQTPTIKSNRRRPHLHLPSATQLLNRCGRTINATFAHPLL